MINILMPIIFKLISHFKGNNVYQIRDNFTGEISIIKLYQYFNFLGISHEELSKVQFITDSEKITDPEKKYLVLQNEDRTIYLFTADQTIRDKLCNVFIKQGSIVQPGQQDQPIQKQEVKHTEEKSSEVEIHPDLSKSLTTQVILTPEITEAMNSKTEKLLMDEDFRYLIRLYITKPDIFSTFAKYVQHGNVVSSLESSKTEKDLSEEEKEKYMNLVLKLKTYNLGISDDKLLSELIRFNGHFNLTLRSLLTKQ
jgi:hypothetical protein